MTMIASPGYKKQISMALNDAMREKKFIASITSAVMTNTDLQQCDPKSILSCALLGESLNLSPSPQLGEYYLVPFENSKEGTSIATFIPGYKGIKQLAMNSGLYKKINVVAVKEGELIAWNPFSGTFSAEPITDPMEREQAKTIGYYGYYELLNGYREEMYWTSEKMQAHADKYSPAFSLYGNTIKVRGSNVIKVSYADFCEGKIKKGTEWLYSSNWYQNFDKMAEKTIIKQLLGSAPKSTQMARALELDGMTEKNGDYMYPEDANELPEVYDALENEVVVSESDKS